MSRHLPWALALALACQEFEVDKPEPPVEPPLPECEWSAPPTESRPTNPLCEPVEEPEGGFRPIVEWGAGRNESCRGLPAVGDLDGDGVPEVIGNFSGFLPNSKGDLVVLDGARGRETWRRRAELAYGSGVTLANIQGDARPEVIAVRQVTAGFVGINGTYSLVAYDADGQKLWETDPHDQLDFDWATAPVVSDMDHDGAPEIVAGRVIFRADGTERGRGTEGRGSWGYVDFLARASEASVPGVADLDLDGQEEVIVGNARYDADGNVLWKTDRQSDGMIAIGNFDDDPEGEVVVSTANTVRLQDTDGRVIWGPKELLNANIVSVPAIADLNLDDSPDIVVAGGNQLIAMNKDGSEIWSLDVQDLSGATGASIFDFEGDGVPEVVYIDEIQMMAVDGRTGAVKFWSDEHRSDTMMDYPVIADVDADDHAEIVVCHANFGRALSVYGDEDNSWRPARRLWNQHAYTITNVADNFTIPTTQPPSWQVHNTYHSAISEPVTDQGTILRGPVDVGAEFLGWCDTDCAADTVQAFGRLVNVSPQALPANTVSLSLYAFVDGAKILVDTQRVTSDVASGATGGDVLFTIPKDIAIDATSWLVVADDLGGGIGEITECAEANNDDTYEGPLCLPEDR